MKKEGDNMMERIINSAEKFKHALKRLSKN